MIPLIFQLDTDNCTPGLICVLNETLNDASTLHYEFITPELLFSNITATDEFQQFCTKRNISLNDIQSELTAYLAQLDTIDDEEDYPYILSEGTRQLIKNIKEKWSNDERTKEVRHRNTKAILTMKRINVASTLDILLGIDALDGTVAQFILHKYFGTNCKEWAGEMHKALDKDFKEFFDKKFGGTPVHTAAFIDGKQIEGLDEEELFAKMMANAGKLMGALNVMDNESDNEDDNQTEPWEQLVTCISDTYQQKNPLIGREAELSRAMRILCRKDKNNPLFVGEPGVGKTALIYGLASMLDDNSAENKPELATREIRTQSQKLKGTRIYALDMTSINAGASYHGEFEKRMKMVLDGAQKRGNCIIYIDEIHSIMGNGQSNNTSAAEILKPYLEDGRVRFIGSTTYKDYNKHIANNKAIARRFGLIDIKEPTVEETISILTQLQPIYEQHHGVRYTAEALRYTVEQTHNLIHDRFLPDKAIDLIDEAGAYLQQNPLLNKKGLPKAARYQKVDTDIIRHILTEVCRIDAKALSSNDNTELKDLDKRISNQIYGQDEAVRKVVRSVMMSKAGLMEPDKPIASLLFVGPTGVGKTEVCKVLAQELGVELIRFDMSEYTEKHTISKLIGSPAGYVGYDEGGLLTDAIRKTPNCVLLLDEIEKAHSDIYNILLQVMDYAKLTDNKGNRADFRNVILIMTSNAGAQFANQASIGFGNLSTKGDAMLNTVKKTFKPEFLNRLSGTVVFRDMDQAMASMILDKKLKQLSQRLSAKNVTIELSTEAHDFLLKKGFTTQYGAREMDRAVQQYLTPLLMEQILFGSLRKGGHATIITKDNDLAIG